MPYPYLYIANWLILQIFDIYPNLGLQSHASTDR